MVGVVSTVQIRNIPPFTHEKPIRSTLALSELFRHCQLVTPQNFHPLLTFQLFRHG
jgi:hypothetical protein